MVLMGGYLGNIRLASSEKVNEVKFSLKRGMELLVNDLLWPMVTPVLSELKLLRSVCVPTTYKVEVPLLRSCEIPMAS